MSGNQSEYEFINTFISQSADQLKFALSLPLVVAGSLYLEALLEDPSTSWRVVLQKANDFFLKLRLEELHVGCDVPEENGHEELLICHYFLYQEAHQSLHQKFCLLRKLTYLHLHLLQVSSIVLDHDVLSLPRVAAKQDWTRDKRIDELTQ